MLGQIFGSKDVSRAVAQNAAAQTGQDPSLLKRMLPMLAMLVAGYLAKNRASGGGPKLSPDGGAGLGGVIGGMLSGQGTGSSAGGGLGGLLGMGGQRNPLDDILGRLGR